MKMVIDMPDEMYDTINRGIYSSTYDGKKIRDIVMNGTPLKKGEWILQSNGKCKLEYARFKCSNCNKITFEESNYCPRCGAEMESD